MSKPLAINGLQTRLACQRANERNELNEQRLKGCLLGLVDALHDGTLNETPRETVCTLHLGAHETYRRALWGIEIVLCFRNARTKLTPGPRRTRETDRDACRGLSIIF